MARVTAAAVAGRNHARNGPEAFEASLARVGTSRGQTRKVGGDRGFRVDFQAAVASDVINQPRQSPVELRNLRDAAGERCVEGV